jgi:hypothetical protein
MQIGIEDAGSPSYGPTPNFEFEFGLTPNSHLVFRKTLKDLGIKVRVKEEASIQDLVHFHTLPQG